MPERPDLTVYGRDRGGDAPLPLLILRRNSLIMIQRKGEIREKESSKKFGTPDSGGDDGDFIPGGRHA